MAELEAAVFSASIENEDAIRHWIESVQDQAGRAHQALDDLAGLLDRRPHVSIALHRTPRSPQGPAA